MTGETAFCERIGKECNLKKQAIATREMHALAADTLRQYNNSFVARAARLFSRVLPFGKPLEVISTDSIEARRDRYDAHIAQPCEGDVCAMEQGLEKL